MELSCKSEYALLALLELGLHFEQNDPLQIRQIAAQQQIPDRYLEQVLATLRRAGFVKSQRGARGGYLLTRAPWEISLLEVIGCLEGYDPANGTEGGRLEPKTAAGTVVHDLWHQVRQAAAAVLEDHTLQHLVEQHKAKQQADLMYYI